MPAGMGRGWYAGWCVGEKIRGEADAVYGKMRSLVQGVSWGDEWMPGVTAGSCCRMKEGGVEAESCGGGGSY